MLGVKKKKKEGLKDSEAGTEASEVKGKLASPMKSPKKPKKRSPRPLIDDLKSKIDDDKEEDEEG